jgi:hypothetical protein
MWDAEDAAASTDAPPPIFSARLCPSGAPAAVAHLRLAHPGCDVDALVYTDGSSLRTTLGGSCEVYLDDTVRCLQLLPARGGGRLRLAAGTDGGAVHFVEVG